MLSGSTVYVVDDDLTMRVLLQETFNAAQLDVKTYASAEDFLASYNPANIGCLLLDILMPGMSGLELQERLIIQGNKTPIIFLTGTADVKVAVKALKLGAIDFIEKPVQPKTVVEIVKNAMEHDLRSRVEDMHDSQIEGRISHLTPRELEVMTWMVRGKPNKVVARILGISGRTVEVHRKNVLAKMQANSVADLVTMVLKVSD